ncbi:hypothetical protein JW979_03430 [bacterium]|nr:hypothetical protein [candidate division CSSED10-310 bacterium]
MKISAIGAMCMICVMGIINGVQAAEKLEITEKPEIVKAPQVPKVDEQEVLVADVLAKNICLSCRLEKKGAHVEEYQNALLILKATGKDKKDHDELNGAIFHYLVTNKSADLIHKHKNEIFHSTVKLYLDESVAEVLDFSIKQQKTDSVKTKPSKKSLK